MGELNVRKSIATVLEFEFKKKFLEFQMNSLDSLSYVKFIYSSKSELFILN